MGAWGHARGLLFVLLLVVSAFLGSVLILLPAAVLLLPLRCVEGFRSRAADVRWWWFSFAAACVEGVGGVEYEVVGDDVAGARDRTVLVICNHHCRLDWLFLWPVCARHGRCGALHITLKDSLKHVPLFGWAMQAFGFCFLSRVDRASDVEGIRKSLGARGEDVYALLFPEGTDLSPSNSAKARAYGSTLDPPRRFERVLVPRAAGVAAAIEAFGDRLDAIYDVTLAYDVAARPYARPDERGLVGGAFPNVARVRVDRVARGDLPRAMRLGDVAATKLWLLDKWDAKEARLKAGLRADRASPRAPDPPGTALAARYHLLAGLAACATTVYGLWSYAALRRVALASCAGWASLALFGGLDGIEARVRAER